MKITIRYNPGMAKKSAAEIIKFLDLEPLGSEGGYFRQTFKSPLLVSSPKSPVRSAMTTIFYLVTPESYSALHRVKSAEVFHFYLGDRCEMIQIDPNNELKKMSLGQSMEEDEFLQVVVPAGVWQGMKLAPGGKWALFGVDVAPGFEYEDFQLAGETDFKNLRSEHQDLVGAYLG